MPIGSRARSFSMQPITDCITDTLALHGTKAELDPSMDIYADACIEGFSAQVQGCAYTVPISKMGAADSISELVFIECLEAEHTF